MKFFILLSLLIVVKSNKVDDHVSAWINIDKAFKTFSVQVAHKFGEMMPVLLGGNVSTACSRSLFQLQEGLNQSRAWAFQMLDASGKIPNGFLIHNGVSLGDYYECLNIDVKDSFHGKYCMINFVPPLPKEQLLVPFLKEIPELQNISDPDSVVGSYLKYIRIHYTFPIATSVCIPSTCTKADLQAITFSVLQRSKIKIDTYVSKCKTNHEESTLDAFDIFSMSVLLAVISTVFIATLVDVYYRLMIEESERMHKIGYLSRCLLYFSFVKSLENLLKKEDNETNLFKVFHGMRVLSSCGVILQHTFLILDPRIFNSMILNKDFIKDPLIQIVFAGYVLVDVFFFMSAVLLAYGVMKHKDKNLSVGLIIVRRYLRISLPNFFVILCIILLDLLNSNLPFEESIHYGALRCKGYGWLNILYISNYFPGKCNGPTWHLSVDFQMYIASLLILAALRNKPKTLFKLLAILFVISICGMCYSHIIYKLPPTSLPFYGISDSKYIMHKSYFLPHYHFPTYLIGITTGYILATKKLRQIPKKLDISLWIISLITLAGVIFGVYFWNVKGETPSQIESVLYGATHRWLWTLGIAWITVSSYYNNQSLLNRCFGSHLFVVLSRLSFMASISHYSIILLYLGGATRAMAYDKITMGYMFLGNITCTYIISGFLSLVFEIPFSGMQHDVWTKLMKSKRSNNEKIKEN